MNKYRRFKYPFGGTGYVDPSNPTPDLQTILAYQDNLPVGNNTNSVQLVNDPNQYLQEYTERVRPDLERKVAEVKKQYSNVPKGGTIVRNHDKLYDYYKSGDKLYYRKKGGKNWINISDNDVAQKKINDTIARNKKSYGGNKNATKKEETSKAASAKTQATPVAQGTTNVSTPVSKPINNPARKVVNNPAPKRVQGASDYNQRYSIYGDKYAPKRKNNESEYSGLDSDYLFRVINRAYRVNNDIGNDVTHMQNNQVEIPEAKVKDWRYYLNRKPQSQPTGARGAVVRAAPSKWRGKY